MLTVSRRLAKLLTVRSKSHHPIETLARETMLLLVNNVHKKNHEILKVYARYVLLHSC